MLSHNKFLCLLLLALTVWFTGCTRGGGGGEGGNGSGGNTAGQATLREIKEMESSLLDIMQQADLLPVIEKTAQGGSGARKMTELTFDETTLGEVLKREMETGSGGSSGEQLPQETAAVWTKIKTAVAGLHDQWDRLEPQVMSEKISPETVSSFEEALDQLTAFSTAENYPGTMAAANQLTQPLARFMEPYEKPPTPQAYEMKYYVRNTVLQAVEGNYDGAQNSLSLLRQEQPAVQKTLKDEQAADQAEELDISFNNLQRALDKQNPDLVKINAAVVMENVVKAIETMRQGS